MNKIILGTVQFGLPYGINNSAGQPQKEKVFEMLQYAHNNEIRLLDTADAYGNASDLIGEFHKKTGQHFDIITKFKVEAKPSFDLYKKVEQTLFALDLKQIWGYLYHSFDDFLNYPNVLQQLVTLKKKGLIQHIGLSIYDNVQFEQAIENEEIDLIQLPYNLLDNAQQRGDLIQKAKQKGKIIHTRSAFLQGLFFKETTTFPEKLSPLTKDVQQLQSLTKTYEIDLATLALSYVTNNQYIDNVLIGVDNLTQLTNNLKAVEQTQLPAPLIQKINAIKVTETALLNPSNWN